LRLGAKWFDSWERYNFICDLYKGDYGAMKAIETREEHLPTAMERQWIRVAIDVKGFWVAEYEDPPSQPIIPVEQARPKSWLNVLLPAYFPPPAPTYLVSPRRRNPISALDPHRLLPASSSQANIARTMAERCDILKCMKGARFYKTLEDYDDVSCLNDWENKTRGEFEELVKYTDLMYYGKRP
jgi:hypothetical protein